MNYGDMHFTEDDKKKLIDNKRKICQWIMENIIPRLSKDEKIKVDYGGTYVSPRSWSSKPVSNYHFAVYGEEHDIYSGGGSITKGYIGIGERYGYISESLESTNHAWDIYPIVDNWQYIKSSLLQELKNIEANKKSIHEFQV